MEVEIQNSKNSLTQVIIEDSNLKKELERKLIRSLAGNYQVNFRFAETFSPNKDYVYKDRQISEAKEVAYIIEDSENKISIQHLLFVGPGVVIKHWRQDWIYENRDFLKLIEGHEWQKSQISEDEAKGTWTQKVYQVDDSPRYQGYGTWVHVDGRHFWESSADAALPRRDATTRNDYNVLKRNSHIEIFQNGDWVLEQDNEKIYRSTENIDTLICLEKGLENFTHQDYDPSAAINWWLEQAEFWAEVRKIWSDHITTSDIIKINEDEKLYMAMFDLAKQFTGEQFNIEDSHKAIKGLLIQHLDGFKA
ncbi:MAG TPA: DUF6607 family protein [Edaphocola sp.]|nr:DUF6607 family protein [Edaphocola sp.]